MSLLLLGLTFFNTLTAYATPGQPGSVDLTFQSGYGPNGSPQVLLVQPDGKILAGGFFTSYNGTPVGNIMRLNPDSTLDTTFNPGGTGSVNGIFSMGFQSDGKIIAGGNFTTFNGTTAGRIVRLNADGTVDTTFNVGGAGANATPFAITVQPDGKILIGGGFTTYNGITRTNLARLNTDGTLDTTFRATGTGPNSQVSSIAIQSDGKILIGGYFTSFSGTAVGRVARLNTDGTLDTTFNVGGAGANGVVQAIVVQPDNKILLGGAFAGYNGVNVGYVTRINADGTLDTTFNPGGVGASSIVYTLSLQADGKIIIGGYFTSYNGVNVGYITRLNSNGTIDNTFNSGTAADTLVQVVTLQADGKIIIGGSFSSYNGVSSTYLARINADGTRDNSFNSGNGGANNIINDFLIQADNKILVVGDLTGYNGTTVGRIGRLNANGTLDTTFNAGGAGANSTITYLVRQNDGKLLVGGNFTSYNGTTVGRVARLNADGTLDTTFNAGGAGANGIVNTLIVQSDGKLLIGGNFTTYNGATVGRIARLNADGTLDTTFNAGGTGANIVVSALALQSDGKILVGGNFTTFNGSSRVRLTRLNANGTLDANFNIGGAGASGQVLSIVVQPDNKILVGGWFSTYNGTTVNGLMRLSSDGTRDTTFNTGGTALNINGGVYTILPQQSGSIFIGGYFSSYNGIAAFNMARLNSNGTLDTSFNTGKGPNNSVSKLGIQADGKIIISGSFTAVDNFVRQYIARLEGKSSSSVALTSNPNPSTSGQSVVFTATVTPITATGTVEFNFGGSVNSTVTATLNSGIATYLTTTLPFGQTPVTATYTGAADFNPSLSAIYTHTVSNPSAALSVTSSPNPSVFGQNATFTATVTPVTATGTVTFTIGAANVTASLSGGVATYVTTSLGAGSYPVVASYSGDANFSGSTTVGQYTHIVNKAGTTVSVNSGPNPSVFGQNATFTATVTPATATGSVSLIIGSANVTVTLSGGVATYVTNTLPIGAYSVAAVYGGDANYIGSSNIGQYTHTVVTACNPLVVTLNTDDGAASSCGTFSFALVTATAGQTISFNLGQANVITFSGSLTPTVPTGATIDGGANGVTLEGNGVAGDGLRLSGGNTLTNLIIRHFAGRELVTLGTGNQLWRVRIES